MISDAASNFPPGPIDAASARQFSLDDAGAVVLYLNRENAQIKDRKSLNTPVGCALASETWLARLLRHRNKEHETATGLVQECTGLFLSRVYFSWEKKKSFGTIHDKLRHKPPYSCTTTVRAL